MEAGGWAKEEVFHLIIYYFLFLSCGLNTEFEHRGVNTESCHRLLK